jgi:hypothetical protein
MCHSGLFCVRLNGIPDRERMPGFVCFRGRRTISELCEVLYLRSGSVGSFLVSSWSIGITVFETRWSGGYLIPSRCLSVPGVWYSAWIVSSGWDG